MFTRFLHLFFCRIAFNVSKYFETKKSMRSKVRGFDGNSSSPSLRNEHIIPASEREEGRHLHDGNAALDKIDAPAGDTIKLVQNFYTRIYPIYIFREHNHRMISCVHPFVRSCLTSRTTSFLYLLAPWSPKTQYTRPRLTCVYKKMLYVYVALTRN
jgi:hypothetical protein